MLPFGQTVYLWRLEQGLTQAALAERAGIPRPNLSAIECGKREVSLGTLRALAAALGVRPGILADGAPPQGGAIYSTRGAMERVADAVAFHRRLTDAKERLIAEELQALLQHRTQALRRQPGCRQRNRRVVRSAWGKLTSSCGRAVIQTLADRILERQRLHAPQSH